MKETTFANTDLSYFYSFIFKKNHDFIEKRSPSENVESSVKWSDPGHFLKYQGKFFLSFPCTLFLHIFDI